MVTGADRRRLYDVFVRTSGDEEASILMALLPPTGWDDVARQSDIREVRTELASVRAELKADIAELRGEIAELRAETTGEIAELRAEVHTLFPRLLLANVASMVGIAGLVTAVFSVAG
jgi:hypothetical protein